MGFPKEVAVCCCFSMVVSPLVFVAASFFSSDIDHLLPFLLATNVDIEGSKALAETNNAVKTRSEANQEVVITGTTKKCGTSTKSSI